LGYLKEGVKKRRVPRATVRRKKGSPIQRKKLNIHWGEFALKDWDEVLKGSGVGKNEISGMEEKGLKNLGPKKDTT